MSEPGLNIDTVIEIVAMCCTIIASAIGAYYSLRGLMLSCTRQVIVKMEEANSTAKSMDNRLNSFDPMLKDVHSHISSTEKKVDARFREINGTLRDMSRDSHLLLGAIGKINGRS